MSRSAFKQIIAGMKEAVEIAEERADPSTYRVHRPPPVDVRVIRKRSGLTQEAFARRFGFSRAAVTDWEQGRRTPSASARVLLTIIGREPEAVDRALSGC